MQEAASTVDYDSGSSNGAENSRGLRPEVVSLLEGPESLVVVRALSGMGKSRLVRLWIAERRSRGADDVAVFSARELSGQLADLVGGARRIVVIDDADALSAVQRAELWAHLAADAASKAVLCVSTLSGLSGRDVPVGLTVREVGADQLKIRPEHMSAALREWSGDDTVSSEHAQALHALTDGWPGLARLLASELASVGADAAGPGGAAGVSELTALLTQPTVASWIRAALEVAIADREVRVLVRRLALAPRLVSRHFELLHAGDEAVAQSVGADELMQSMRHVGIFDQTQAGDAPSRKQIIAALRLELVAEARADNPAEFKRWNVLFAEALAQHGGRDEVWIALSHARAAEHWALMSELWSKHNLGLLNRNFQAAVVAYSDLPDEAVQEHPGLLLAQVLLASLGAASGDSPAIWLRAATEVALQLASTIRAVPTSDGLIGLVSAIVVHQRVAGSVAEALSTVESVERELEMRAERGDLPTASNLAWWKLQSAVTLLLADEASESIAVATEAYEVSMGAGIDAEHVVVNAAAHLALCNVLVGSEREAEEWLAVAGQNEKPRWYSAVSRVPARIAETLLATERLDRVASAAAVSAMGDGVGPIEMWPFIASAAARHELTFGDPGVMLAEFDRVERAHAVHGRVGHAGGAMLLARTRADALLASGDAARAADVIETAAHVLFEAKPDEVDELLVPYARAHLYGGQHKKAARLALQAVNAPTVWHGDQLEALFVVAEAQLRLGDEREAARAFSRAHALAVRRGAWRVYLTIPAESLEALLRRQAVALPDAAASRIRDTAPLYAESAAIAELTGRESVVLWWLAEGLTTASIAAELSVSPNTVKSQVASLYAKLGVRDRATALVVAERRGLVQRPS